MPRLVLVAHDGATTALDVAEGTTVMHAAIANGVAGIAADCNGYALCATCHVFVDHPALPPMDDTEDALLDGTAVPRRGDSRLACQIRVTVATDGLLVRLPERQA